MPHDMFHRNATISMIMNKILFLTIYFLLFFFSMSSHDGTSEPTALEKHSGNTHNTKSGFRRIIIIFDTPLYHDSRVSSLFLIPFHPPQESCITVSFFLLYMRVYWLRDSFLFTDHFLFNYVPHWEETLGRVIAINFCLLTIKRCILNYKVPNYTSHSCIWWSSLKIYFKNTTSNIVQNSQ